MGSLLRILENQQIRKYMFKIILKIIIILLHRKFMNLVTNVHVSIKSTICFAESVKCTHLKIVSVNAVIMCLFSFFSLDN